MNAALSRTRTLPWPALLLAALAFLPAAPEVAAQDLRYTETTRMEMGGAMGAMMSMMGGMGETLTETVWIQGPRMRRDTDGSSTIVDWSTNQVMVLDHEARTVTRMDWSGMADDMTEAREEMEGRTEAPATAEGDWEVRFSSEPTGRTEEIAGYAADQVLMVMELLGQVPAEEQEDNPMADMAMAVVTELWLSTDFPAWTLMSEAQDEMAASVWGGGGVDMGLMGAMDPRFRVAMEEQQEALGTLRGIPIRTVMSIVSVPLEEELDVEAVLDTEELGEGMAGMAAAAARQGMRSRMGDIFGGGDDEEPEAEQSVVMRATSEVTEVTTTTLDDALFQVPEGYTERATPGPGR